MRQTVGGLRARLAARFERSLAWRVEDQLRPLWERLDEQQRRIDELNGRIDHVHGELRWTAGEVERIVPQVAAQEAQLESLREKLTAVRAGDSTEIAEARSVVEQVRREHAQIRVRLTGIARYEDRLRALEDTLDSGKPQLLAEE
jgi:predicted  nucleic acid-binding Zn-ribbon protein